MLTDRQVEAVRHIANGATEREAADAMGITFNTLHTHIRAAKRKANARTMPHLVALAIKAGQISRKDIT